VLDVHLYDIERVEALAGPQGTLYGASSEAGTIRLITRKPDPSGFAASYAFEMNSVSEAVPATWPRRWSTCPDQECGLPPRWLGQDRRRLHRQRARHSRTFPGWAPSAAMAR
jgi:hypothetical protein